MRGEISLINSKVLKMEDNPIKDDIGKHTALHIISVINDEYWKEWKRKMDSVPNSTLKVENLGNWTITFSHFKRYIWELIRKIRSYRQIVKNLEKNPDWVKEDSSAWVSMNALKQKLSVSWKQLEEQRKMMILKYLIYTAKKRKKDPNFKPKYDYTWFPYSFKNELLNNSKVDLSTIQSQEINYI